MFQKKITDLGSLADPSGRPLVSLSEVFITPFARHRIRHSHLAFELTLVREGGGVYVVGETPYPLEKGAFLVFAGNEPHCLTRVDTPGLRLLSLRFEPRLLSGGAVGLSGENARFCFCHSPSFSNAIPPSRASRLSALLEEIETELREREAEYPLRVRVLLDEIAVELIRRHGYAAPGAAPSREGAALCRRVSRLLDCRYAEPLTLAALAEEAGISPPYLSSLFHAVCGISLWDYLLARRVEAASRLLTDGVSRTVLETALLCGFNNTANFNKAFRKITGVTPRAYRALGDPSFFGAGVENWSNGAEMSVDLKEKNRYNEKKEIGDGGVVYGQRSD